MKKSYISNRIRLFINKKYTILGIFIIILLLNFSMCKTSSQEAEQFSLSVDIAAGITGNPLNGSTIYAQGSTVNYNYQLDAGYQNLVVSLDGVQVTASGIITMDRDHSLIVTAEEGYSITGDWDLELSLSKVTTGASILETINVSIEFSGSLTSGDVFINGINVGTYTVQNEIVGFLYTLTDPILGLLKYEYTGEFLTNNTMGGDVVVYKVTSLPNNLTSPMADIAVKRGKWKGKRK